jgi:Tfp pilus assembly protein PilF
MHPESSSAFASLGDAYMQAGQRGLARDNYREALIKNPKDARAAKQLVELTH